MAFGNNMKKAFAATLLAASTLFIPAVADAKPVREYDQMSLDDRGRYFDHLIVNTVAYLRAQGRMEDARKVDDYFRSSGKEAGQKFSDYLDAVRTAGRETGKNVEVEHAMILTLRSIGVDIPKNVAMTLATDFHPTAVVARNDNKPAPQVPK